MKNEIPDNKNKTKSSRKYSSKTVALLFGLSGNRCAHPDCANKVIENATEFDDEAINGNIAHIIASSETGPRSYILHNYNPKLLDTYENLILVCRHHHGLIDIQSNTYTPQQIRLWKSNHLDKNMRRKSSTLLTEHTEHSFMGVSLRAFVRDAKLIDIGQIETIITTESHDGSTRNMRSNVVPYIFEYDNGTQFSLTLTNSRLVCAVGNRITALFYEIKNEKACVFSVFDHSFLMWHAIPQNSELKLVRNNKVKYIMGIVFVMLLLQLTSIYFLINALSEISIIILILAGSGTLLVRYIRISKLKKILIQIQDLVNFN